MPQINAQDSITRFNVGIASTLTRIVDLWERQGLLVQPYPDAYSKLVPTLNELKKLLTLEQACHDKNIWELYDLMAEIEAACCTLGRVSDDYLIPPSDPAFTSPYIAKPRLLKSLSVLHSEIQRRRAVAQDALQSIAAISERLDVPAKKDRLLVLERTRGDFLDVALSRIYYKWHTLALEPEQKDPTDLALAALFLSPPLKVFLALPTLVFHPSLTRFPATVGTQSQVHLEPEIPLSREKMICDIQFATQLLERPDFEQDQYLAMASLKKLSQLHGELLAEVEPLLPALTAEGLERLTKLWDRCHVAAEHREALSQPLKEVGASFDNLEVIFAEHARLQFQVTNAPEIFERIKRRKVLIDKLREFEARHASKDRFKGNSVHLLREERFRKTEYPQLVELENVLLQQILAFEALHRRPFEYEGGKFRLILSKAIERRKKGALPGPRRGSSVVLHLRLLGEACRLAPVGAPSPGKGSSQGKRIKAPPLETPNKSAPARSLLSSQDTKPARSRKSSICSDTTLVAPNSPASHPIARISNTRIPPEVPPPTQGLAPVKASPVSPKPALRMKSTSATVTPSAPRTPTTPTKPALGVKRGTADSIRPSFKEPEPNVPPIPLASHREAKKV
ncbi:hypothetical protein L0F63_005963 [Massospora cicadina]|nr:hypothetical protein L0F63_005963 [Massospora cicadina]